MRIDYIQAGWIGSSHGLFWGLNGILEESRVIIQPPSLPLSASFCGGALPSWQWLLPYTHPVFLFRDAYDRSNEYSLSAAYHSTSYLMHIRTLAGVAIRFYFTLLPPPNAP